jgi:3-hydroxybutyryl-CoA dehydratase
LAQDTLELGTKFAGAPFSPTRESIHNFCEASLDFNPLHLDDRYMAGSFGKTRFDGIIMHGMTCFGVISRMLTDWAYARGGVHRRLETRWKAPVKPGDTITPSAVPTAVKVTRKARFVTLEVLVTNQRGEVVATGEAMAEFPPAGR